MQHQNAHGSERAVSPLSSEQFSEQNLAWSETMQGTPWQKWSSALLYLVSIILGNVFVILFGIGTLSLGDAFNPDKIYFSVTFPLGALWIGLTFSFRDFVQRYWSHQKCWIWMAVAAVITYFWNKDVALASMLAFIGSEACDWAVFYVLKNKELKTRVMVSNLVSCPLDSLIFVPLAFGVPWYSDAVWGQAVVKYVCSLFALPFIPWLAWLFNKK